MLLYFIISNFIFNIIFLGFIIYFIILLLHKNNINNNTNNNNSQYKLGSTQKIPDTNNYNKNNNNSQYKLGSTQKISDTNYNNNNNNNDKIENKKKIEYDKTKCFNCIAKNQKIGEIEDCPHCGSENYDTGCIPAIVKEGKPNNCVPKELSPEEAFWACKSVSDQQSACNLIHPKNMLEYQKKECKRSDGEYDYYCAFDESDSCTYNKCSLKPGEYYSYGPQSICDCQKVPNENLPPDIGRECITGKGCAEYQPNRKAPELLTDPALKRFYNGYASYMDVPTLNTWYSALIADSQAI